MGDTSVSESTRTSALWVTGGHLFGQCIRLGSNLIFTRILAPEMFGVMAAANLILIGLAQLSDIGIYQSIVREKDAENPRFLDTIWVVQLLRGVLIAGLLLLIILSLWQFGDSMGDTVYAANTLVTVLLILSVYPMMEACVSPWIFVLQRNMQYRKPVAMEICGQLAGLVTGLSYVFFIAQDIYALVVMQLVYSLTKIIFSHSVSQHRFRFKIHWQTFIDLIIFGRWIVIASLIGFLFAGGERLIIGAYASVEFFGVFAIAIFILVAIKEVVAKLIGSVMLSAIGQVQRERDEEMAPAYFSLKLKAESILFFLAGALFIGAPQLIDFLYDARYTEAGSILSILAFSILSVSPLLSLQLLLARGKSFATTVITAIQTSCFFAVVIFTVHFYGIWTGLWSIAVFSLFQLVLGAIVEYRELHRWFPKRFIAYLMFLPGLIVGYLGAEVLAFVQSLFGAQ